MKKILLILFAVILLVGAVDARIWSTNTFNNSLSSETMNITAGENTTRWLEVPSDVALITTARFNLTGFVRAYANTATPVAYYNFSQGSGNLIDLVTGVYNQTPQNSPITGVSGILDTCWNFTGADSEYTTFSGSVPEITDYPFSMNVWVRTTSGAASDVIAWIGDKDSGSSMHYISIANQEIKVCSYTGGGPTCTSSGQSNNNNEWIMVTGVWYSATNRTLYLNGSFIAEATTSAVFGNAIDRMQFARAGDSTPDGEYDGDIDEAGIWNISLTIADIGRLYNDGNAAPYEITENTTLVVGADSISLDIEANGTTLETQEIGPWSLPYVGGIASTINKYLTADYLVGSNYLIPFYFYSDLAGNLTYQNLEFSNANSLLEDVNYTKSVYDTERETFVLNISYDKNRYESALIKFYYGGTAYSTTETEYGNNSIFTSVIDIPAVNESTVNSLYWLTELVRTGGGTVDTEYIIINGADIYYNQTVTESNFSECAVNPVAVNYTIEDEDTGTAVTVDFEATFLWSLNDSSSIQKNLSVDLSSASDYDFCINVNRTFFVDAEIELSATGYETRKYNLALEEYDNDTTTVALYMINTSVASKIIIEVKDEGLSPLEGYTVRIYRDNPATGERMLVEEDVTNAYGQIVAQLIEDTVDYDFEFYDTDGDLVKEILDSNIACKATFCVIPVVIEDTTDDFGRYSNIDDFTCSLSFDSTTNNFTFSWNDATGDTSPSVRLLVQRIEINATTNVCNSTSSSLASSLVCQVGSNIHSYSAQAFRTVGGTEVRLLCDGASYGVLDVKVGDLTDTFGLEGFIWGFIVLFSCVLIGVWSPSVGTVLYLIGMVLLGAAQIIYLNPAIVIAQVVIGGLLIWALRQ